MQPPRNKKKKKRGIYENVITYKRKRRKRGRK
jgi:hypothetical protein